MAIVTRSLTLNAAFLQEIKEDNRHLRQLLSETESVFADLGDAFPPHRRVVDLLWRLRDQLAMHFALEDAYGYFDDAIITAPQLSVTAECLRSQHSPLFQQICELADSALELSTDSEEQIENFLDRFDQFQTEFQKHEEAELKLILDALDDDIGVGD